ncbi:hypothetical protein BC938DRAFT_484185 [Jimgerdemannia flammicorona]|uniref:SET domain-containing protein n=1 Tax=Jimgerdemannia flammicorona TaxID=994334 RepID=A0A433R037_9FUNG|nr:hypothetical protein BC938DRAFT_484185 [Jimgerdemannia flammicorona]
MFIRVVRDLSEGEEVCVTYIEVLDMYEVPIKKLKKRNFECHCPLCDFERAQPEERHCRAELFDEFTQPEIQIGNVGMMPRLKIIMDEFRKTHLSTGAITSTRSRLGKKNITASGVATKMAPPALQPHQHPIGLVRTLSAFAELNTCLGRINQAVQALLEVFEYLPCSAGINLTRVDLALLIGKMYGKLKRFDEVERWKKVARSEFRKPFGEVEELWLEYVDNCNSC